MSDTPRADNAIDSVSVGGGKTWMEFIPVDFARQLERELNELRSQQMTEEKAREVLGDWISRQGLFSVSDPFINWISPDEEVAFGSDNFTALQLRAIAWWMGNMKEVQ